jgi:hypothetical protein
MQYLSAIEIKNIFENNLKKSVADIKMQHGGYSSRTHKIVTTGGEYYYFKENKNNHKLEVDLTYELQKFGIPLPEIVQVDENWMLMVGLDGVPLKFVPDVEIRKSVLKQAGKCLAKMNAQKITGYGPLVGIYKAKEQSYYDFYKDILRKIDVDKQWPFIEYVRGVKEAHLCHGDMALTHIFVDSKGKFQAFLDIDDVLGAPHYYDLAEFDIGNYRDTVLWTALMSGYSEVLPEISHLDRNLLLEEYLITVDSYYFFNRDRRKYFRELENDQKKLRLLEDLIWKN